MEEGPVGQGGVARDFRRTLSGFGVIILTLSVLSPGVSIFVSGGTLLQQAGTGAIFAFVFGSLICYCQTSMSAELGAAYPTAGYDYAAIGHAVGDWAGAMTYIASLLSLPLFLNTSAVGIALYLRPLFPGIDEHVTTVSTIALITGLSMLNIQANEKITGVFLLIETVALLLVAVLGMMHAEPGRVDTFLRPMTAERSTWVGVSPVALAMATAGASWALAGSSQALLFSEDMKHPHTIGRLIMLSFLVTAVLETAPVVGTIVGSHDLNTVLGAQAPFQAFLSEHLSSTGMKLVSLSIAIAIFNACLAGFIGNGRNVFSMGRAKLFGPTINHALTRLLPRTDAPWITLLLIGAVTALATLLTLRFEVMMLSGALTFITLFYVCGVFAGRRSGRTGVHGYRTPLYPLIPVLGILIVVGEIIAQWEDRDTGRPSLFIWLGMYALSFLYYRFVLCRRRNGWRMIGPTEIDAWANTNIPPAAAQPSESPLVPQAAPGP